MSDPPFIYVGSRPIQKKDISEIIIVPETLCKEMMSPRITKYFSMDAALHYDHQKKRYKQKREVLDYLYNGS